MGLFPPGLSQAVNAIVASDAITAKLKGLGQLIEQLKKQDPDRWRLVVFTTLRETQTTIQNFLENYGFKVGIINGDSDNEIRKPSSAFERRRRNTALLYPPRPALKA